MRERTLASYVAAPVWWFTAVLYGRCICGRPDLPGRHHRRVCVTHEQRPATPTSTLTTGGPDTPDGGSGVRGAYICPECWDQSPTQLMCCGFLMSPYHPNRLSLSAYDNIYALDRQQAALAAGLRPHPATPREMMRKYLNMTGAFNG